MSALTLETLAQCSEETPELLRGSFDLFLTPEGETEHNVGNVRLGTFQERLTTFEGFPPDGSLPDDRETIYQRESVSLVVTADHMTCRNLGLWLEASPVNVLGGFRLNLDAFGTRTNIRVLLQREMCSGTRLDIVLHRAQIVSPSDLLFTPDSLTVQQFTLRALRDSSRPSDPYGYFQLVPGDCAVS